MLTIGIDPGLNGALAVIDHKGFHGVYDVPVMQKGKGTGVVKRQVNTAALANLVREVVSGHDKVAVMVVLEQVGSMPGQGVSSMFSLGHTAGAIEGMIVALGLPHHMVAPATWKAKFKLTKQDKAAARALAQRWYPDAPLAREKDHNRAEAILLARYGQEEFA